MTQNESQEQRKPHWTDRFSWNLAPFALVLAVLPIQPEPHLIEKTRMLLNGVLTRPLDIFDFFMHGTPITLFAFKAFHHYFGGKS